MHPSDISTAKPTERSNTIVILDIPGSMGQNVKRIVTQILPLYFKALMYTSTNPTMSITFETDSRMIKPPSPDGDVEDQDLAVQEAGAAAEYVKNKNVAINQELSRLKCSSVVQ
ncbi:hypothetical protein HK101_001595 [Irineochytrium annulatum]|nr:hypothetical protein HK101_001595 [Irineochytrium annulatum]